MFPRSDSPEKQSLTPDDVREQACKLHKAAEDLINDAVKLDSIRDRSLALDKASGMIAKVGRLTGHTLTVRAVLDSPSWRKIRDRIADTLESHPDALESVVKMLAELEAAGG